MKRYLWNLLTIFGRALGIGAIFLVIGIGIIASGVMESDQSDADSRAAEMLDMTTEEFSNDVQRVIKTHENSPEHERLRELLIYTVEKINETAPKMLNPQTRVDGASVGSGLTIIYEHTFLGNLSAENAGAFERENRGKIRDRICAEPTMRRSLRRGASFVYTYKNEAGSQLVEITIREGACKEI